MSKDNIKELLSLVPGDIITNGHHTFVWLGEMMGAKGCRKCTEKEIKIFKSKDNKC